MKLKDSFKSLFSFEKDPKIKCNIKGFELSLSKEEIKALNEASTGKCLHELEHFVVSVRPTGENPEYPADDKETQFRFVKMKEDSGHAYGMCGSVCFIPHDAKWTGFELSEQFNRGRDYSGQQPADHHGVSLKASFKRGDGVKSSMSIGSANWVRKSDLEGEEWAAAQRRNRNKFTM